MKYVSTMVAASLLPAIAAAETRVLSLETTVNAAQSEVWNAWTTEAGIETFFARAANVELRTNGAYEIFFFPDNEAGQRGAEGTLVLAVEPMRRLAFTWDAPPMWPTVRAQRTMVEVRLREKKGQTRVTLTQVGWGDEAEWDEVYQYFQGAWAVVLKRLRHRFNHGPVDWDNLPDTLRHRG